MVQKIKNFSFDNYFFTNKSLRLIEGEAILILKK